MQEVPPLSRGVFFWVGMVAESALVGVAALLGLILRGNPFPFELVLDGPSLWQSLAATLPMLLYLAFATSPLGMRFSPLRGIHERLRDLAGHAIGGLRGWEIVLLSLAAGAGEEVLFRGVLQPSLGILLTSVLFGLLHAVTVAYLVLTFVISLYFGWLMLATENLVVPILAHALYDTVALFVLRRRFRAELAPAEERESEADVL
jgi:membrane protease YdiL (CAAX protease family)